MVFLLTEIDGVEGGECDKRDNCYSLLFLQGLCGEFLPSAFMCWE